MTKNKNNLLKAICGSDKTTLNIGNIKIPCYVLNNKMRVLSGRAIQNALGFDPKSSGTGLITMLGNKKFQDGFLEKSSDLLSRLQNERVEFERNDAGGAAPITHGHEATLLVDIADLLMDAKKAGILTPKQGIHADYAEKAIRAFAKVGIIALIDEATGYEKIRETGELIKFFKEAMIRETASDRVGEFEKRGVFDGLYKIYNISRKKDKPWQHPLFFGNFFIKYVYKPLDTIITDGQVKTRGIMLRLLKEKKNLNRGTLLYQFIAEVGEAQFFEHLTTVSNLMKIAGNKKQFDILFDKVFDNAAQDDLFPEPEILKLFESEVPLIKGQSENDKIINSIRADYPLLQTEMFEERLEKAAFSKAKK